MNRSLADPGQLTFAAMRDLKKVIDLVREMESRAAKEREQGDHGRGGLSDETAGRIRRKIPGMTDESEEDGIRQE